MQTPDRTTSSAREAMLDAARRLFAQKGLDGVSLREVGRAAGQRNTNAVQYHFGDRENLVREVLAPHHDLVGGLRTIALDAAKGRDVTVRDLAEVLVRPSAAALDSSEGRDHLRIVGHLVADPAHVDRGGLLDAAALGRWNWWARRSMPSSTLPLHRRFSAINLCFSELGRRAAIRRRTDHRLFVSDLVDLVSGVLGADVSSETLALLEEKNRSRPA